MVEAIVGFIVGIVFTLIARAVRKDWAKAGERAEQETSLLIRGIANQAVHANFATQYVQANYAYLEDLIAKKRAADEKKTAAAHKKLAARQVKEGERVRAMMAAQAKVV
jgi:hypothetical protein